MIIWVFPRLVGRYCSYLLPKQTGGTTQIIVFKTLQMAGRPTVYLGYLSGHPSSKNILFGFLMQMQFGQLLFENLKSMWPNAKPDLSRKIFRHSWMNDCTVWFCRWHITTRSWPIRMTTEIEHFLGLRPHPRCKSNCFARFLDSFINFKQNKIHAVFFIWDSLIMSLERLLNFSRICLGLSLKVSLSQTK